MTEKMADKKPQRPPLKLRAQKQEQSNKVHGDPLVPHKKEPQSGKPKQV